MAIEKHYRRNFQELCRAIINGDVALVECQDAETKNPVMTICVMTQNKVGEFNMIPVAKMFDGNPYEQLIPPPIDTVH